MKKKILTTLSIVLVLGMAALGILAYLTDTDSDVNVMTLGNVDIEQVEQQLAADGVNKEPFEQDKDLFPGTTVSKIVSVKNVGDSTAYVRTLFAFEVIDSTTFTYEPIWTTGTGNKIGEFEKDGVSYEVYEYVYDAALVKDATTPESLAGVKLGKDCTNADMEALGGTYEVLVLSQAGQVAGFENVTAAEALDTMFGDAEANAATWFGAMMPWDGNVPTSMPNTLVVDKETQTIHVKDAAAFAYLSTLSEKWAEFYTDGEGTEYGNYAAGAGAEYYYSNWTIVLDADIDLNNNTIDPVKIYVGTDTGAPTFDGNNHMIKNAKIKTDSTTENEAGLFVANNCIVKNLKLDNIHVTGSNVGNSTAGILSGSVNTDQGVQNITITNSSVTGGKYTGGVIGYGYTDVLNCTLTNVTVKGVYKIGGLVGYIAASSGTGDVTGNTLTDCKVDGIGGGVYAVGKDKYIVGKLVGNYNCNGTCNNNTITNMTTLATENIGEIEAGKTVTQ